MSRLCPALSIMLAAFSGFGVMPSRALAQSQAQPQAEQARSCRAFIDSLGINPSIKGDSSNYALIKARLLALGLHHIRYSGSGSKDIAEMRDLAAHGIKTMYLLDQNYGVAPDSTFFLRLPGDGDPSPGYTVHDFVKKVGPGSVIDSVEMTNEIDAAYSYKQQYWHQPDFPTAANHWTDDHVSDNPAAPNYWVKFIVASTQASWKALKSDPATRGVAVIGPALGVTYDSGGGHPNPLPSGSLYACTDFGGVHPYPYGGNFATPRNAYDTIDWYLGHGDIPSCNIDRYPYIFTNYQPPYADPAGKAPPRAMIATETGYPTPPGATSEMLQGKYIPRLFCEYFRAGIPRTFIFEMLDHGGDPSCYGILHGDYTPKPAYTALKNMIRVLGDASASTTFRPGSLRLALAAQPVMSYKEPNSGIVSDYDDPSTVHRLLLQKSDGDFYLIVWNEVSGEDASAAPRRPITPPAMPAALTLPASVRAATVYSFGDDGALSSAPLAVKGGTALLSVPDKIEIIRLRMAASPAIPRPSRKPAAAAR